MPSQPRILVTGNNGYIGPVLTAMLVERGYDVVGLDTNFYGDCFLEPPRHAVRQIAADVRDVTPAMLSDVEAVIHLAGLSNDPLGEFKMDITEAINYAGAVRLAETARRAGVKRFVYASSQSMYGIAKTDAPLDEDHSEKAPLTAYARTKWEAEVAIKALATPAFLVTCFRPSTVFGASPNLRCDIVFNNLVACGYTTGRIEILSDGTPWRPVVHVRDVAAAFIAGVEAPAERVAGESFNVGIENGNYTVRDLAEAARDAVGDCELVFTGAHGKDARTYRVSFEKILTRLAGYYTPGWTLARGGRELVELFDRVGFTEAMFRGRLCNRLPQLKQLIADGRLREDFRWRA